MKLRILFCLFIILKSLPSWSCQRDTVRLFYDINKKVLTPRGKTTLDSLNHFLSDTTAVHIFGFADYLGKRDSNYTLAKARAENAKNYLLLLHTRNVRITADGRGQVDATTKTLTPFGEPFNRRVDIIITKPAPQIIAVLPPVKHDITIKKREIIPQKRPDDSVYTRINNLPNVNVGDSLSFKEFTFLPGRHFLRQLAIHYMVALKDLLKANPNIKIEIQGHICCQYDGKDGLDFDTGKNSLSLNRAKYIYDYLVSEGISADRLRYKGLGSKEPKVYPELSAEDQDQNRRVVIVLIGK
jgi:outer membrane protein OmpA-like peptidoglycan-associated protein